MVMWRLLKITPKLVGSSLLISCIILSSAAGFRIIKSKTLSITKNGLFIDANNKDN